jgi:hypothetical protein
MVMGRKDSVAAFLGLSSHFCEGIDITEGLKATGTQYENTIHLSLGHVGEVLFHLLDLFSKSMFMRMMKLNKSQGAY